MEETTDKTEKVEKRTVNKKPFIWLLLLIILLFTGMLFYLLYSKKLVQLRLGQEQVQQKPALLTIKTKAYETASEKGIQLYLVSKNEGVEISAFQIKLDLPAEVNKEDLVIKSNTALEDQGWVFPIARAEEEEGKTVIKFSGFRLGNSPYTIKGNLLLATISSQQGAIIIAGVNSNDTLIYSSDAVTIIPFDSTSE